VSATTAQLLAQIERFGPRRYLAVRAILAGIAAQLAAADAVVESFATSSTVGGASGAWLTLLARGYGIDRAQDETDASLRDRLRDPVPLVTPAALLEGVDAILADYTATPARLVETRRAIGALLGGPDEPALILDLSRFGDWNHFTVIVPRIGDAWGGGSVLELLDPAHGFILGIGVLGLSGEIHPAYFAIVAFLRRARAAGIRVSLAIED
jgi:hypothetical protein